EQFLGEETFRRGVGAYLRKHAFGNARNSDLWAALGAASGQPVNAIMDTWIHQPGYPLISVEAQPAGDETEVNFRQERFLYDPSPDRPEVGNERWQVPILFRAGRPGGRQPRNFLLDATEARQGLPGTAPDYLLRN